MIGSCVILALAILFIGIQFLKGINIFSAANTYTISYENVQGLSVSAPVNINGFKVGIVRNISYDYDNPGHVKVEIEVDDNLRIPKGSEALIESDLLGTASITLKLASGNDFYAPGSEIPGALKAGMMDNVGAAMDDILPSVSAVILKVDTLLTSLNNVVTDPSIKSALTRIDAITANLETTSRDLNALLATLPPITRDVKAITGNFNTASENLSAMSADVRQLPLDSLMNSLQTSVDNLKSLSEQLKDPNSTLGLLMNDPKLYNNLNSTVMSLDSLFTDIKANPKRYINIKVF